jgi:hypothetical protein
MMSCYFEARAETKLEFVGTRVMVQALHLEFGPLTTVMPGVWLIPNGTHSRIENKKKLAFTVSASSMPKDIHMRVRTGHFFIDTTRAIAPASSA